MQFKPIPNTPCIKAVYYMETDKKKTVWYQNQIDLPWKPKLFLTYLKQYGPSTTGTSVAVSQLLS